MTDKETKQLREYNLRARLPQAARWAALALAGVTVAIVVAGFYTGGSKSGFKLKTEHTQLSTEVIAEVDGYERLESDGDVPKYYIKADVARTYSDNHQELENAFVRIYGEDGVSNDQLTADQALYVPEVNKDFTAYLKGNVNIETRDALKVKTESITYTKASELAESEDIVEFERENIRGRATGASVRIAEKKLELLKDVEIETFDSPDKALANVRYAKLNADSAIYDQTTNRVELNGGLKANVDSDGRKADVTAGRALARISGSDTASRQLKQIELFDAVHIVSSDANGPATIDSGYALFDKDNDRFELKNDAHIVASANGQPTDVRAAEAIYERAALRIALSGGAQVSQGSDNVRGDSMNVELFAGNKVMAAAVRGNAFLRQAAPDRITQVSAAELHVAYSAPDQLRSANAVGSPRAELVPAVQADYSKVTMSAPRAINVSFKGLGSIDQMTTDGRTTIQLDVPDDRADAANKRLTADAVKTYFNESGKDIRRAEAIGAAELLVDPKRASAENYQTTVNAPRFDCDFFPTGNNARVCVGGTKTKTVRKPTVEGRAIQTMVADRVTANFSEATKDVEMLEASGSAKFSEADRNAMAAAFTYSQGEKVIRLRGGDPTYWDNRSRAKSREIDWNTGANVADIRGNVSTTVYSANAISGASPFAGSDKPVFVTSEEAHFDQGTDTAAYTGNARAWQGDNFVRADKLVVFQREGKMQADGNVQSGLYDVKLKRSGKDSSVPVFAAARQMIYDRDARRLSYRQDVDIRQGTDRISSGAADVFLNGNNEVVRTVAETSVVMTQPGRRAVGDWVEYTAQNEVAILRGNPATVNDAENGSTQSQQITVYMRENRFTGQGTVRQNPNGRVKSVYKVKNPQ